jgi:hypothetical protein
MELTFVGKRLPSPIAKGEITELQFGGCVIAVLHDGTRQFGIADVGHYTRSLTSRFVLDTYECPPLV